MECQDVKIGNSDVRYFFNSDIRELEKMAGSRRFIIVTDQHVFQAHHGVLNQWNPIVISPGEQHKNLDTLQFIISELLNREAGRDTLLIGIGGGVVTDITGLAASVYMRGIAFGLVPTTLLNMVDASIGGKNGIDIGLYKNMIGTISQPEFIYQDIHFLSTLPDDQWVNGFAEIIKHACIKDRQMFGELGQYDLSRYQRDHAALQQLLNRNVRIKLEIVQADEKENGERKLLNFGHTIGHALETTYGLSHGHAVSIGMVLAAKISEKITGYTDTSALIHILRQYGLPTHISYHAEQVFDVMKMDKKRRGGDMNFILLKKTGEATIETIPLPQLRDFLKTFERDM